MKSFFSREQRLSAPEVKEVLSNGVRFVSNDFVLICLKNNNRLTRLGISCSRKVGGAVTRNRLRRWFREAFRLNQLQILPGLSLVVLIRPQQKLIQFDQVVKGFLALLKKADLLK